MKARKAFKKLQRRIADYDQFYKTVPTQLQAGYNRPGSLKK